MDTSRLEIITPIHRSPSFLKNISAVVASANTRLAPAAIAVETRAGDIVQGIPVKIPAKKVLERIVDRNWNFKEMAYTKSPHERFFGPVKENAVQDGIRGSWGTAPEWVADCEEGSSESDDAGLATPKDDAGRWKLMEQGAVMEASKMQVKGGVVLMEREVLGDVHKMLPVFVVGGKRKGKWNGKGKGKRSCVREGL